MSDAQAQQEPQQSAYTTVLVTGAGGFLAGHLIKLLLSASVATTQSKSADEQQPFRFLVRATVRSLENSKEKYAYLYEMQSFANQLQLFECDLSSEENWESAIHGCTYILHTANPTLSRDDTDAKIESQFVSTVMTGMRIIFENAYKHHVKRIVYTSSINTMEYTDELLNASGKSPLKLQIINDAQWSAVHSSERGTDNHWKISPYTACKTLAEKYAWQFVESKNESKNNNTVANTDTDTNTNTNTDKIEIANERKESESVNSYSLELICINPGAIIGPMLNPRKSGSSDIIRLPLIGEYPFVPNVCTTLVDVRDVALAHYRAIDVDVSVDVDANADGNGHMHRGRRRRRRYVCVSHCMWYGDLCKLLHAKYFAEGFVNIPLRIAPAFVWSVICVFEPIIAQVVLPHLNIYKIAETQPIIADLRMNFIPVQQSVYDTVDSHVRFGIVDKPQREKAKRDYYYKRVARNAIIGIAVASVFVVAVHKYTAIRIPTPPWPTRISRTMSTALDFVYYLPRKVMSIS